MGSYMTKKVLFMCCSSLCTAFYSQEASLTQAHHCRCMCIFLCSNIRILAWIDGNLANETNLDIFAAAIIIVHTLGFVNELRNRCFERPSPFIQSPFCSTSLLPAVSPETLGFLTAIGLFLILMIILFLYLNNKLSLENAGCRPCLDEFRKTKELQGKSELCVCEL